MTTYRIYPIPALSDNYIWAIVNLETRHLIIVDPGETKAVLNFLKEKQLHLQGILITHHHWDHTNGVQLLKDKFEVPVYGSANEDIHTLTHPLNDKDEFALDAMKFKVIAVPGHTKGHVAYLLDNHLFSGDMLFAAGCGRIFEGTALKMYESLQRMAHLPEQTLVYCGHEYTLKNLHFAKTVEPMNASITKRIAIVEQTLKIMKCSLPSSIKDERDTNPFLRCDQQSIKDSVSKHANRQLEDPVEVFTVLRQWKDLWKP